MAAVTDRKNRDSSTMAWAGVETGANMLVGLTGSAADAGRGAACKTRAIDASSAALTRCDDWIARAAVFMVEVPSRCAEASRAGRLCIERAHFACPPGAYRGSYRGGEP